MRKRLFAVVLLLASMPTWAQSIAFTFDDGFDPRTQPRAAEWNRALLDALASARVHALLLPAGRNVDSEEGMALVADWARAGHAVGNHTYSHRSLGSNATTVDAYVADIARDQALLETLPTWTRLFRYPFLKEGDTAAKRDAVRRWLVAHHYRPAPVSIDTSDWYYAQRFTSWRDTHPAADLSPWRDAYLAHLLDRATYYDELARRVVGRRVPHVILLHTNALNAAFVGDAIAMFRGHGWRIVSPEQALRDPVYLPADTLPAGESVIWARAHAKGMSLRYPAEDAPYEQPGIDALEARLDAPAP